MFKFLIGLMMGVVIAGGVVYYLNNHQMEINSKILNSQSKAVFESHDTIILTPDTSIREKNLKDNISESNVQYDFYNILEDNPNDKSAVESNVIHKFYLQLGAFSNIDAADEVRVQLNLYGYDDVAINKINLKDKILYKVLMGPYNDESEALNMQHKLIVNGFNVTLINNQ